MVTGTWRCGAARRQDLRSPKKARIRADFSATMGSNVLRLGQHRDRSESVTPPADLNKQIVVEFYLALAISASIWACLIHGLIFVIRRGRRIIRNLRGMRSTARQTNDGGDDRAQR